METVERNNIVEYDIVEYVLIRLHRCASLSGPVLFSYHIRAFFLHFKLCNLFVITWLQIRGCIHFIFFLFLHENVNCGYSF